MLYRTSNTSSEKLFAMIGYLVQVMIDGAVIGVFSSVMMSMGGKERAVHDKLTGARCLAASASWTRDTGGRHARIKCACKYQSCMVSNGPAACCWLRCC